MKLHSRKPFTAQQEVVIKQAFETHGFTSKAIRKVLANPVFKTDKRTVGSIRNKMYRLAHKDSPAPKVSRPELPRDVELLTSPERIPVTGYIENDWLVVNYEMRINIKK